MGTIKEIKQLTDVIICLDESFTFQFDKIEGGRDLFIWRSSDPPVEFHGDELDIVATREDAIHLYEKFLRLKGYL